MYNNNNSSRYSTIWILEPTLLTIISMCLLILSLADYFVPILTSVLCNAQNWTGQKEKKLIEICQNLSITIAQVQGTWASIAKIRHDRPNIVSMILPFTSMAYSDDSYPSLILLSLSPLNIASHLNIKKRYLKNSFLEGLKPHGYFLKVSYK